jgi:hypothetical protein
MSATLAATVEAAIQAHLADLLAQIEGILG